MYFVEISVNWSFYVKGWKLIRLDFRPKCKNTKCAIKGIDYTTPDMFLLKLMDIVHIFYLLHQRLIKWFFCCKGLMLIKMDEFVVSVS